MPSDDRHEAAIDHECRVCGEPAEIGTMPGSEMPTYCLSCAGVSLRDMIVPALILLVGLAAGGWVASNFFVLHPVIDYCPDSEFSCPGAFNPNNISWYVTATLTGMAAMMPPLYVYQRVVDHE